MRVWLPPEFSLQLVVAPMWLAAVLPIVAQHVTQLHQHTSLDLEVCSASFLKP